ncbi:MAG: 3-dehydroquinate synthase [Candidatus Omnitrophota bacterium]
MKSVTVHLRENAYPIFIGNKSLGKLGATLRRLKIGCDAVIVTHPEIKKLHGDDIIGGLKKNGFSVKVFLVPRGEKSKSAKTAIQLIKKIAEYDVKRRIFVVALGGGVIGDLAGFVAAVYKRGIPYIQVPTTLLAQIDSSIGGKVAIDLDIGKNLAGAFYQPRLVWSDVSVLSTLDSRQLINGLAEAVKYGLIEDKKLFDYIAQNHHKLRKGDSRALEYIVSRCSQIKARVVEIDEKETKGYRTILNFGHTVGHAIETANRYHDCHHGEAVALGMRAAFDISVSMGLLDPQRVLYLNDVLTKLGLPERMKKMRLTDVLKAMAHDKKFREKKNRFVLLKGVGRVKVVEGIPRNVIEKAIRARLD